MRAKRISRQIEKWIIGALPQACMSLTRLCHWHRNFRRAQEREWRDLAFSSRVVVRA